MPWAIPRYNQFGGRNRSNNFLAGLQAGAAIRGNIEARKQAQREAERNYLLEQQKQAYQQQQDRQQQQNWLRQQEETERHNLATEKSSLLSAEASKASAETARKKANLEERKFTAKEQKERKEETVKWLGAVDTSDPVKFQNSLRANATGLMHRLHKADLATEPELQELLNTVRALTDDSPDSPKTIQEKMEMFRTIQRKLIGPEKVAEMQQKKLDALGDFGKDQFTRLKTLVPMILKKYVADVPEFTEGQDPLEFLVQLMRPSKNALQIARQKAADGDKEAQKDVANLEMAYDIMTRLAGLGGQQQGTGTGGPGMGSPEGPSQGIALPENILSGLRQGQARPVEFPDGSTHWLTLDENGQPVEVKK